MNKSRKPWLAALLTFLAVGLGQIYCGKAGKGFLHFVIFHFLSFAGYFLSLYSPPYGGLAGIILVISYLLFCLFDAYKTAKRLQHSYQLKVYNRWYFYLAAWALASFLIQPIAETAVKKNITQAYKIPSGAMLNTLQIGDHIICNKMLYRSSEPLRGDVVIFPYPKDPGISYVKRVVGLGGEEIEIRNKKVFINGIEIKEEYVIHTSEQVFAAKASPRDNFGPFQIPEGSLFMMGDNRDNSHDSRFWGGVKKTDIQGKVAYVYWSWDSSESNIRWGRISRIIH